MKPFRMNRDWSVQSIELRRKFAQLTDDDLKFETRKTDESLKLADTKLDEKKKDVNPSSENDEPQKF